jgi:uncharacterized cupin superfamily protein
MTTSDLTALVHAAGLSGLDLEPRGVHPGATAGAPEQSSRTVFDDGRVRVGVWECTPGCFETAKAGIGEQQVVLAGDATVRGADGTVVELGPGETLITPDGWRGSWEIRETVRKVFVIWQSA